MADSRTMLRYLCGACNTVLKESEYFLDRCTVTESCPNCARLLALTLTVDHPPPRKPASPAFQAASTMAGKTLTFGINQLDSFYQDIRLLSISGRLSIVLVSRLCVRALLPKRHGGLQSDAVIFIDAGNVSDIYQCTSYARQYGMNLTKVLDGIIVSRAFTIYQLTSLVMTEMPEAVKRFGAGLVVISGLLDMFNEDPQVDRQEARRLVCEIMVAAKRVSRDVPVVISLYDTEDYADIFRQFITDRLELHGTAVNAVSRYGSKQFSLPEKAFRLAKVQ